MLARSSRGCCMRSSCAASLVIASVAILGAGAARAERLPVRVYSTEDGLPRDEVLALAADRVGHLWLGTDAGLTRFDGQALVSFGEEDGLRGGVSALLAL